MGDAMPRKKIKLEKSNDEASKLSTSASAELLQGVLHHDLSSQAEGLSTAKVANTSNEASAKVGQVQLEGVLHHSADEQRALSSPAEGLSKAMVANTSNQTSLDKPESSSVAGCNRAPAMPPNSKLFGTLLVPQSNIHSQSNEVQQNQEQHTQPRNIQSEIWDLVEKIDRKIKGLQSTADDLKAQSRSLESESRALKQLLPPNLTVQQATETNVLLPTALQGGENTNKELSATTESDELRPNTRKLHYLSMSNL